MKINRQELVNALEVVRPGLASKEMIEQSTSFAFINERIVTYNDEISISHPVKNLNITGAIKAEELYKLLGKLTGEELEIEITETEVLIQSEKAKAGFSLQKEITLPLMNIEELSAWKEFPDNLSTAMLFCLFSCSKDMSHPVLTCIHLQKDGIVESCDNYRATRYEMGITLPLDNVLIPGRTVEQLLKYEVKKVAESPGWLHFKTEDETIFSCRIIEGKYITLSPIFQGQGEKITFPEKIKDILEKASVFSKRELLLNETVSISLDDKKAYIRAEGESGWFEEEINARYSGEPITFHANPAFLQEICEKLQTCHLAEGKIKFIGENWEHVVALQKGK